MNNKEKVILGMSGGVDSSASAVLLLEEGYEVTGVTFLNGMTNNNSFAYDAASVADKIGIKHEIIDLSEIFKKQIASYFILEYTNGRNPNPCVNCNEKIK